MPSPESSTVRQVPSAADRGLEPDGAARRRVAQGVGDQVAHRLFEPARIGEHLVGVGRDDGGERDAGGPGVALVTPHDVLEDPLDREHPRLDRRRAVLVPGQVEQVGDDALEAFGFAARGFEIPRAGSPASSATSGIASVSR